MGARPRIRPDETWVNRRHPGTRIRTDNLTQKWKGAPLTEGVWWSVAFIDSGGQPIRFAVIEEADILRLYKREQPRNQRERKEQGDEISKKERGAHQGAKSQAE